MLDMPALSPTMEKGNLISWAVSAGEEISAGQVLAEIETDKATLPFENQEDGFVASLLVEAGTKDIPTGTPLAVIVEDAADIEKMAGWRPGSAAAGGDTAAPEPAESSQAATGASAPAASGDQSWAGLVSPAARILLGGAGIDPAAVVGTGPKGLVTKGDALLAVAGGALKAAPGAAATKPKEAKPKAAEPKAAEPKASAKPETKPAAPKAAPASGGAAYKDVPVTQMRRIIADRLLESKTTIPATYMRMQVRARWGGGSKEAIMSGGGVHRLWMALSGACGGRWVAMAGVRLDGGSSMARPAPQASWVWLA